jgi:hypothetical protein
MHEKHLIGELLFGEKKNSFSYTNQVKGNSIEPSKEVEDMKQPVLIEIEAENEDYYATSEARKKDKERKSLSEEKNEKNQYGSSYDFSYDCNNVFEFAGLQDNNQFLVVNDYEENMEENEDIDEENIESIFMVWSPEEIKYYYELMLQQSVEKDIDHCI